MSEQVQKVVANYKKLAQIPSLVDARILLNGIIINSFWTQRNLESAKLAKFLKTNLLSTEFEKVGELTPADVSEELLSSVSSSDNYKAVLRCRDGKQFLEVWYKDNLNRCVDLERVGVHGEVYTEEEFAAFEWSPDETKILYVAEKKQQGGEEFYKRRLIAKDSLVEEIEKLNERVGDKYIYKQNWGDQLEKRIHSVIVQYDIEEDKLEVLQGIPKDICPATPIYSLDGSYIIGVGYNTKPRKLGLTFRTNRPSVIFKLDFDGLYEQVSSSDFSVKCPRFNPDGDTLVWLQRKVGGPHSGSLQLVKTAAPPEENCEAEVVIDVVQSGIEISGEKIFYGLYNVVMPKRCWASGNRLLLSTNQKNEIITYVVDNESGDITELEFKAGSQTVLDVFDDIILLNRQNFLVPDRLVIGRLPDKGEEATIEWTEISVPAVIPEYEGFTYHYMELTAPDAGEEIRTFNTIYVGPESGDEKEVPFIVCPHGGPHNSFVNKFSIDVALFASMGYAVLLVNYRGSSGAGQDSLNHLIGRIGKSDVADCVLATVQAYIQYPWIDSNRAVLVGGSHGGFLVAHLSAHYPDLYKAVVARNPIFDVATMAITSDIPDWCFIETNSVLAQGDEPDIDDFVKMRKISPIQHAHKVKAPTLLCVGSNDLRVPWSQAKEYYYRLKANGVTVRMNVYNDSHPLNKVDVEMDFLINTVLWIERHCVTPEEADSSSDSD